MYLQDCSLIHDRDRKEEFMTYCKWLSIKNALDFKFLEDT